MRAVVAGSLLCAFTACVRGERTEPAVAVAPAVLDPPPAPAPLPEPAADAPARPVTFGAWEPFGFGGCAYLAPKPEPGRETSDEVDLVFHFHAGQLSDREIRASGLPAVFVSCGFGNVGTAPYSAAFADPNRFERMMRAVLRKVGATRVRKLALVSWSAGFASTARILAVPRYYEMTDAVVLLDSLHSAYEDKATRRVDVRMMGSFVRFARDAARGEKAMVVTHSAIVPPGYASSTEATRALLDAIDVPIRTGAGAGESDVGGPRMKLATRADAGNLHVRGFRGTGPHDHFDHLHLVGEVLASWLVPRWKKDGRVGYTSLGEER